MTEFEIESLPVEHENNYYHVRWMIRRDMPEVIQIEKNLFSFVDPDFQVPQIGKLAWSEDNFLRNLRERNVIGMVAEQKDLVVGYMVYELHKQKITILKIEGDSNKNVTEIIKNMLSKLYDKMSQGRREKIQIIVPEKHLARQLLLKEEGFHAKRVVRGHFDEDNQDGYLLEKVFFKD